MFAALVLKKEMMEKLPDFYQRLKWFQEYREKNMQYQVIEEFEEGDDILLSLVPKKRLEKLLKALLDENEFLSPGGIRALSKYHLEHPYSVTVGDFNKDTKLDLAVTNDQDYNVAILLNSCP